MNAIHITGKIVEKKYEERGNNRKCVMVVEDRDLDRVALQAHPKMFGPIADLNVGDVRQFRARFNYSRHDNRKVGKVFHYNNMIIEDIAI